ncbi:MAG: MarR family transcriptional regulator [Planctomycetes bacterium]|nr:MarR family transcriptional regulator [Planctomycetota bacterium]
MPVSRLRRSSAEREATSTAIVSSLQSVFQQVDRFSKQSLARFGVTGPQIWALRTIEEREGITLGELTRAMYLHPSTLTGIIDRLVQSGLISRERSPEDRRVIRVRLRPRGRRILARAPEPPRQRLALGLANLDRKQLEALRRAVACIGQLMGLAIG